MRPQFKRFCSLLLLCVFVLYITPKEVYHLFTSHNDTEHSLLTVEDGLQISNEHHHCELMKLDQHFASADISLPYYDFFSKQVFFDLALKVAQEKFLCSAFCSCCPLRGPPVFVV